MSHRSSTVGLLLACALLFGCPPAGSQQAMRPDTSAAAPEARADFDRAQALFEAGRFDEAARAFQAFGAEHPASTLAAEAEFRHGVSLNRLARYAEAREVLQDFLNRYPTSGRTREAAVELGLSESKLGHQADAEQILRPVVKDLSPQERKEVAPALEAAVQGASPTLEAIREAAQAAQGGDPAAQQRLVALIDSQASFLDVTTLYAQGESAPAFGLVAAKMARVYAHLGDPARAREAAEAALAHGAGGMDAQVKATLDRLALHDQVQPTMVGVILPLSGRFKSYGDAIQDGISLAIRPKDGLQVVYKDSQADPLLAAQAVEELAKEGAIAILGPVGIAEAPAAAVRAEELGVPMLSLSRAEGLTDLGRYIFRDSLTNSEQGRALARYATEVLKTKSAAVLAPDIPSSSEVSGAFWSGMEDAGGEIRGYETYRAHDTTFSRPIQKLVARDDLQNRPDFRAAAAKIYQTQKSPYWRHRMLEELVQQQPPVVDFDALLIPDYYKTIGLIAPALAVEDVITNGCDQKALEEIKKTTKQQDIHPITLLGTADWDSPELVTRGGRYVMCSVFVDGFYAQSDRPATKSFVDLFQAQYQRTPGLLEAQGYDAASLLRQLLLQQHPATRDALLPELAGVRRFPGATGETTFTPDREADKPLFFLTVGERGIHEVDVKISPYGLAAPAPKSAAR